MKRLFCLLLVCSLFSAFLSACADERDKIGTETAVETSFSSTQSPQKPEKESYLFEPEGVSMKERAFPDLSLEGMNDAQKALVTTAESYLIRGSRAQYEDTLILGTTSLLHYRWAVNQRSPEEYTAQNLGFLQCAAFCYEVYRNALDLELIYDGKTCYYTSRFESYADKVLHEKPASTGFSQLSREALDQKKAEFLNTLVPGDIIVYRTKNNGHAMLYVGNGKVIHSSGSLYAWDEKREVFEPEGTIRMNDVEFLFDEGTGRYIFDKQSYFIVRPLQDFSVTVPEKSKSRMNEMRGVLAEKLSSHPFGKTANPGDEITFTFSFVNQSQEEKSFPVRDTIPSFTEYISGDFVRQGEALSCNLSLSAGEKKSISYTVKVKHDALFGSSVKSDSFAGEIPLNCPSVQISKTLTPDEQKAVLDAADSLYASEKSGLALANEIYQKALGRPAFDTDSAADLMEDLFRYYSDETEQGGLDARWSKVWRSLDRNSKYLSCVVPDLYGGRNVPEGTSSSPLTNLDWFQATRTRYVSSSHLIPGDVILVSSNTQNFMPSVMLFTGDALLSLSNYTYSSPEPKLSQLVAEKSFVVLRPSMGF